MKKTRMKLMIWEKKEKILATALILMKGTTAITTYAAPGVVSTGVPELDNLLNAIVMILAGIVFVYGLVKLINGIKAWSDANEEMDAARKSQGVNTIISGTVCVMVLPILTVLGYVVK